MKRQIVMALAIVVGHSLIANAQANKACALATAAELESVIGAKVSDLSAASVKKWQAIARTTAWKDYADRNENCAKLMKLAEKQSAKKN